MQSKSTERWCLTSVAMALLLVFGGPLLRSPDGAEMLGLAASWLGGDSQVASPGFWPPLWPALNLPAVALGHGEEGARLLNLLLMGLVVSPLYRLADSLGGRTAARLAVLVYLCLPPTWEYASILDARPLSALFFTMAAADVLEAARGDRSWRRPFVMAALGLLSRPEGIVLPFMVTGGAVLGGLGVGRAAVGLFACHVPPVLLSAGSRALSGHEPLLAPWFRVWPVSDMLALMGPASVPTSFRAFVLGSVDQGTTPGVPEIIEIVGLVVAAPIGVGTAVLTLASTIGFLGMAGALIGFIAVLPRHRRWWIAALVLLPFSLVALAPMAQGQAGPVANLLFLLPGTCATLAVGMIQWRPVRWMPVVIVGLVVLEAWINPLRAQPSYFVEGGEAADLATERLRIAPPLEGRVATGISGRSVVIRAGFQVVELPPPWIAHVPSPETPILISSVDVSGEDGGRARMLLEDPEWTVAWVVGDGDIGAPHGIKATVIREDLGWYALLVHRPGAPSAVSP